MGNSDRQNLPSQDRMMRAKERVLIVLVLAIFISIGLCTQKKRDIPLTPTPTHTDIDNELSKTKLKAEIDKLQKEAEKLSEEVQRLKSSNQDIKDYLTASGTIIGSLILVGLGFILNRALGKTQESKMRQDKELARERHELEKSKMEQDKDLAREHHLLEVFKELGASEPKIRIGAAAILLDRLKKSHDENKFNKEKATDENRMIASVLLAVTKSETSPEIQKYIADGLIKAIGARFPDAKEFPDPQSKSPLIEYGLDFQKVNISDAYWKMIDARGVDFFGANLSKCSFREAFLQGAVFYNANLKEAVLIKAKLESANFQSAVLEKTNFTKADLRKANLKDVDISKAIINGADLRGAEFDSNTKLKREQLSEAQFSEGVDKIVTILESSPKTSSKKRTKVVSTKG